MNESIKTARVTVTGHWLNPVEISFDLALGLEKAGIAMRCAACDDFHVIPFDDKTLADFMLGKDDALEARLKALRDEQINVMRKAFGDRITDKAVKTHLARNKGIDNGLSVTIIKNQHDTMAMLVASIVAYSEIAEWCIANDKPEQAIRLFSEMRRKLLTPTAERSPFQQVEIDNIVEHRTLADAIKKRLGYEHVK
jgi:hypothetical protein